MLAKALSRIGIVAAVAMIMACATGSQKHAVSLGGGAPVAQNGLLGANGTREGTVAGEQAASGLVANSRTGEGVRVHRASAQVATLKCVNPPTCTKHRLAKTETVWNVKTTAGIDWLFAQGYSGSATGSAGLVYIGLSNDALTETTASTTLSNEIAANGLSRAIGTYAHTAGTSTATISKTFTCSTGAQSAQKAALFTASSGGTMTHVLSFTQRSLQVGDQLAITFTITLSYDLKDIQRFEGFAQLTVEHLRWHVDIGPAIVRDPFRVDEEQTYLMAA